MSYKFEYTLDSHHEAEGVWLSCKEIPEMHAAGDDLGEALASANDAMDTAMAIYVRAGRKIPTGEAKKSEAGGVLRLSALSSAKVALWNIMLDGGVSRSELARRLKVDRPLVDRLLNFQHDSKISGVERALHVLGYRLAVTLETL